MCIEPVDQREIGIPNTNLSFHPLENINLLTYDPQMSYKNSAQLCESCLLKAYTTHKMFVNNDRCDKFALIIEPRFHTLTEAVIFNFMHFLNPRGWNLIIASFSGYHTQIVERFPYAIVCDIADNLIHMDENGLPNISTDNYNAIMMDIRFWRSLPGNRILVFQLDCIMFRMFDERFLLYDYAGANFRNDASPIYGGINGGFSIRNRRSMIDCLEKVTWEDINEYRKSRKHWPLSDPREITSRNEDVFFTHACEILAKNVPDIFSRTGLAMEVKLEAFPVFHSEEDRIQWEEQQENTSKSMNALNRQASVYHGWHKNHLSIIDVKCMLKSSPLFSKYLDE